MATDIPYVFWRAQSLSPSSLSSDAASPAVPMPSLYALSVFTTLNARKGLRRAVAIGRAGAYTSSGLEPGPQPLRRPVEVRVERVIQVQTEEKREDVTF